jgi:hypothetical protein
VPVAQDPTPQHINDRVGSYRVHIGGNAKAKTESLPALEHPDEDAPAHREGVVTTAVRAGEAIMDVGAAVSRSAGRRPKTAGGDVPPPRSLPMWVTALVATMFGGGGHIGSKAIFGPDPEVVALTARFDAITVRVDRAETAIAAAEVMRVAEVRFLIDLSVKGFGQLGVKSDDLPAMPVELADRYHTIEVEDTQRKMFPTLAPAPVPVPSEPGTIAPP